MSRISLSLIELLIKGIPEGLLDVLALYLFTRTTFNKKNYLTVSIACIIVVFIIRWLPMAPPVRTMLNLFILIILFIFICKVDIKKVIVSVLFITILLFISELLNMQLLTYFIGSEKTAAIFNTVEATLDKTVYGIPSTIIFAIFVLISYFIIRKIDNKKIKQQ